MRGAVPQRGAVPGAGPVVAVQTFGDSLGSHLFRHGFSTDGWFYGEGVLAVPSRFNPQDLMAIFDHRILRMLLCRGKISRDLVALLRSWRHSGFHVYSDEPNRCDFCLLEIYAF